MRRVKRIGLLEFKICFEQLTESQRYVVSFALVCEASASD